MSCFKNLHIVVCLLQAIGKEAFGQMRPSNAVAEVGGEAIFNCSGTSFLPNWLMSKDGTTTNQLPIAGSCNVNPNLQSHYKTEQIEGPLTCNLIVFNVTMEQAGAYWCTDGVPSYALLTVIDSSPNITVNSTTSAVEKESIHISCTLKHNGSVAPAPILRPHFYWTDSNGRNVSSSNDSRTNMTAVSQLTVTAGRQNIMPYTCHVYLQLMPTNNPGYASNTPNIINSASSPTVEVLYGPSTPLITSKPEVITNNGVACGISVLMCSSSGNPSPNYKWFDTAMNVSISDQQTLTLAEVNRNYKCDAHNTIRNELLTTSTTYTVSRNDSVSYLQYCEFPRSEFTLVTVSGCENASICVCSEGSGGLTLTCIAVSYPTALYVWRGTDGNVIYSNIHEDIATNGTYYCTAYFDRALSNYTGTLTFPNGTSEKTVTECSLSITTSTTSPTTTSTKSTTSTSEVVGCNCNDVAIAMGVLFGISLAVNITILIIWLCNCLRAKPAPFRRTEDVLQPEMMDLSNGTSVTSAYEELRHSVETRLHPATYEKLTPNTAVYAEPTISNPELDIVNNFSPNTGYANVKIK